MSIITCVTVLNVCYLALCGPDSTFFLVIVILKLIIQFLNRQKNVVCDNDKRLLLFTIVNLPHIKYKTCPITLCLSVVSKSFGTIYTPIIRFTGRK